MEQNSLTLDEVKSHFEQWRASRSKLRERIPQYLWNEVKVIIDDYPLSDITRVLRITTYQIKDNLKINPKINFTEVVVDHSAAADTSQAYSIELHRKS
jgi:hypothetical protein